MTPEWLRAQAEAIQKQRLDVLFGEDEETSGNQFLGDDPEAVEYFLLSVAALEHAHRFMNLALLKQTQAVAAQQRGR